MKKVASIISLFLVSITILSACGPTKDADYLYDWLTEHGTLVNGTRLEYSYMYEPGSEITLCYDTAMGNSFYVNYTIKDYFGRKVITKLFLFSDSKEAPSCISVYGIGEYSDYYRSLEYYHAPALFTKNSPIERGELGGSTVHVPDSEKALITEILALNTICEDRAQTSLCRILDWLENTFCPAAKMSMSDFGYEKY